MAAGQLLAPAHTAIAESRQNTCEPFAVTMSGSTEGAQRAPFLCRHVWSSGTKSVCLSTGPSALPKGQLPPGWGGDPAFVVQTLLSIPTVTSSVQLFVLSGGHPVLCGLPPLPTPPRVSFSKASWPRARRISVSEPGCEVTVQLSPFTASCCRPAKATLPNEGSSTPAPRPAHPPELHYCFPPLPKHSTWWNRPRTRPSLGHLPLCPHCGSSENALHISTSGILVILQVSPKEHSVKSSQSPVMSAGSCTTHGFITTHVRGHSHSHLIPAATLKSILCPPSPKLCK